MGFGLGRLTESVIWFNCGIIRGSTVTAKHPMAKQRQQTTRKSGSTAARRKASISQGSDTDQRVGDTREYWENRTRPLIEAVELSERLDESDFAIRINARG